MHVTRVAVDMNWHYRFRSVCNGPANCFRTDIPGISVNINKNRTGAGMYDGVHRRTEGEIRDNDFIAYPDTQSRNGQMQSSGSVTRCQAVRC